MVNSSETPRPEQPGEYAALIQNHYDDLAGLALEESDDQVPAEELTITNPKLAAVLHGVEAPEGPGGPKFKDPMRIASARNHGSNPDITHS